jgi:hypothetical protein
MPISFARESVVRGIDSQCVFESESESAARLDVAVDELLGLRPLEDVSF